jgi:hypothetical protein
LKAKKSLRDTAEALEVTHVVLGEMERGRRPMSWDQVEIIALYLDTQEPPLHAALTQFHHAIWSGQKGPRVLLEEQTERVASVPLDYDMVELAAALRSAISSMDIGQGALERASRIIRHPDCGSVPYEFVKDAEMTAQASMLLEASLNMAKMVLENPPELIPPEDVLTKEPTSKWKAPEDWKDAKVFEVGKVYQFRGTGELMHIVGEVKTTGYGHGDNPTLVGETQGGLKPIGAGPGYTDNYREVPLSQWYADWLPDNGDNDALRRCYDAAFEEEQSGLAQRDDEGVEKSFVPRISLDFDGVVHSYQSGWAGDACVIPDPPVPGAFTFITEAIERGMDVNIFSTRSHVVGARSAMYQWLVDHGMESKIAGLVRFPEKKPNAILLIDDRGFHFQGTFPSFEYIDGFKPWNKGGERDDIQETPKDILALVLGCHDYNGGHRDGVGHDAFHHGIDTVSTVITRWLEGADDPQIRAVKSYGAELLRKKEDGGS